MKVIAADEHGLAMVSYECAAFRSLGTELSADILVRLSAQREYR
jgi:hypothetical protein